MKTKAAKMPKQKRSNPQDGHPELDFKAEAKDTAGFADSKALSQREIENLKEQLEELNRENTTGG